MIQYVQIKYQNDYFFLLLEFYLVKEFIQKCIKGVWKLVRRSECQLLLGLEARLYCISKVHINESIFLLGKANMPEAGPTSDGEID